MKQRVLSVSPQLPLISARTAQTGHARQQKDYPQWCNSSTGPPQLQRCEKTWSEPAGPLPKRRESARQGQGQNTQEMH